MKLARAARRACNRWEQISTRSRAELIACKVEQFQSNRVDVGNGDIWIVREKGLRQRGSRTIKGNDRKRSADDSSRREPALLPRSLVIDKKIAELALR